MTFTRQRIDYKNLNARQKENFNYAKLAAVLADYGYVATRLTDDWKGADLIAQHIDSATNQILRIQLKSRLAFRKDYQGKDLYVAFPHKDQWYLFPHDELLDMVLKATKVKKTVSWTERGGYAFAGLSKPLLEILEKHKITGAATPIK